MLSSGLMNRATYSEVENKVWNQRGYSSGDSAFTDVIWDKMRVLPTDPGEFFVSPPPGRERLQMRLTAGICGQGSANEPRCAAAMCLSFQRMHRRCGSRRDLHAYAQ